MAVVVAEVGVNPADVEPELAEILRCEVADLGVLVKVLSPAAIARVGTWLRGPGRGMMGCYGDVGG